MGLGIRVFENHANLPNFQDSDPVKGKVLYPLGSIEAEWIQNGEAAKGSDRETGRMRAEIGVNAAPDMAEMERMFFCFKSHNQVHPQKITAVRVSCQFVHRFIGISGIIHHPEVFPENKQPMHRMDNAEVRSAGAAADPNERLIMKRQIRSFQHGRNVGLCFGAGKEASF